MRAGIVIMALALLMGLWLAYDQGRREVLRCAGNVHDYDPRAVVDICKYYPATWADFTGNFE